MSFFTAEYSTLSSEALLTLVKQNYNLSDNFDIQFIKRGINDTYLIYNQTTKYILRVYKSNWRTLKSIEEENELLFFLSAHKRGNSFSPQTGFYNQRAQERDDKCGILQHINRSRGEYSISHR